MKVYPIKYEIKEINDINQVIIFCYNKIVIRVEYPLWFYVESSERDGVLFSLITKHKGQLESKSSLRSTIDPHHMKDMYKVLCPSSYINNNLTKILKYNDFQLHSHDYILSSILKMLNEKNIRYYSWFEVDVTPVSEHISIYKDEYMGTLESIKMVNDIPPSLSIFSFDIETTSYNVDKFPSSSEIADSINVIAVSYQDEYSISEYCLVYGPNITSTHNLYKPKDATQICTFNSEYDLLYAFFLLIIKIDPDIITGHNILGFDFPYITDRWNLLACLKQTEISSVVDINIPNISRYKEHVCNTVNVSWNNNQVTIKGSYPSMPGRICIDTYILAARNFLGPLINNKLDTLGTVLLGMSKDDIAYKDMFLYINAWFNKVNDDTLKSYVYKAIDKYNGVIIDKHKDITIDNLNVIIKAINNLDQRETKIQLYELTDVDKLSLYNEYYDKYKLLYTDRCIKYNDNLYGILWWIISMYCLQDTRIPLQIIRNMNIVSILREQSSVFCVGIEEILTRGQVYTITNSQFGYNYKRGYCMDFGLQGGNAGIYKYNGGYVAKNEPGLKTASNNDSVVYVVDFSSLYPTIIIAYNLCYTTYVPVNLRDKLYDLYPIPSLQNTPYNERHRKLCNIFTIKRDDNTEHEHWFLKESVSKGTISEMLYMQYNERKHVKKLAYEANSTMKKIYDAQQLAIKVSMNSTYGGFGTVTNRLANFAVAETVTYIGRSSIIKCNEYVKSSGIGEVVYNDTDSAMIRVVNVTSKFNRDCKLIREYGDKIAADISALYPKPMSLECENVFVSFFLYKPKMYAAIKWNKKTIDIQNYTSDYIQMFNLLYIKGLAPVRRDKYKLNKDVFKIILTSILTFKPATYISQLIMQLCEHIWQFRNPIKMYPKHTAEYINKMFTYNFGISSKSYYGSDSGLIGKWNKIYKTKYGKAPDLGSRYDLLVSNIEGNPGHTKTAQNLVTLDWFIEENRTLDVIHYIQALESDGNIVSIANTAFGNQIPDTCITKYILRNLLLTNKAL